MKLPGQTLLRLYPNLPPYNLRRQQTDHLPTPSLFGTECRMSQESPDVPCCLDHRTAHYDDTVIVVTKSATKESFVTSNKSRKLLAMQIAKDFFQILPLGPAYLTANLLRSQPRASQSFDLMTWDVVVE
jgi:hypothetical protein